VGMISEAQQADDILREGKADMVLLARALLRDPYWPVHAALELGAEADIPPQYLRGYHQSRTAAPAKK
jgi:2,4-dienoyl-CoA reductase-like NADH-dependent reductase (Old Yellow Enzyme family)